MKILIADQDARLLKRVATTFGRHCEILTAQNRAQYLAHLGQDPTHIDLVVAGDKLLDYTGLELLGEVAAASPVTLRIFLARPARLDALADRLEFFGLFATLTYPLDPRMLLAELHRARESLKNSTASRKIRHVVLQEEWETGERPALEESVLDVTRSMQIPTLEAAVLQLAAEPPDAPAEPTRAAVAATAAAAEPTHAAVAATAEAAARPAVVALVEPATRPAAAVPTKAVLTNAIPTKAIVAKGSIEIGYGLPQQPAEAPPTKSLSELARLAMKKQPLPDFAAKNGSARRTRTWLYVGSGMAAVAVAALLALRLGVSNAKPENAPQEARRVASTRLFSSSTTVTTNGAGVPTLSAPQPAPPSQNGTGTPRKITLP